MFPFSMKSIKKIISVATAKACTPKKVKITTVGNYSRSKKIKTAFIFV